MKRTWVVTERRDNDLITHLLGSRGVIDREAFLHPEFSTRPDPHQFLGVPEAVSQISRALKEGRRVGLYGDYDCDGIPGTALLFRALAAIGTSPFVYIPKRESGYGLSEAGVDVMARAGVKLLITIDSGTTSHDEIAYARTLGMDVIVTDHHEPHRELPDALVLNPKLLANQSFRDLCGTGVVYTLVEGMSKAYPALNESWLKWHLDLVALATICDMVELTGENRVLTKYGLGVLQKTRNKGLQALINVAGIDPKALTAGMVGFGLGPRINAAGRTEHDPMLGFRLLTTDDVSEAETIARVLHQLNADRQDLIQKAFIQAESLMQSQYSAPAIALEHPDWNAGILGLIASKLLERYHKPVFIFDAKTGKGSARSIRDYPLPPAMEALSTYFSNYGGHALAGGMSLKPDAFSSFKSGLHQHAGSMLGLAERVPHLHIDAEISLGDVSMSVARQLEQLEPFGIGNAKPVFALRGVKLDRVKMIGAGQKHLRGSIVTQGIPISFVAFGMADRKAEFEHDRVDLAGKIEQNFWNGRASAELHVVDVK